ncbi:hypothetical protein J6590_028670 [Homalodisca vitripennis]|nr:hypothetical protein J6590_028670 [Homalodisca vitripennis]
MITICHDNARTELWSLLGFHNGINSVRSGEKIIGECQENVEWMKAAGACLGESVRAVSVRGAGGGALPHPSGSRDWARYPWFRSGSSPLASSSFVISN